jgi:hypothetical protein
VLNGDDEGENFGGILTNEAVPVVEIGDGTATDALVATAGEVPGADFTSPLAVVLSAEDAVAVVQESATANTELAALREVFGGESFVI